MNLVIVSPEKTLYSGSADSVVVPGAKGSFEVLDNHAPIISALDAGVVVVRNQNEQQAFDIKSGFIEVADNEVSVCIE